MSDKHENDFFFLVETDVFSLPFERGLIWNNYVRLSLSLLLTEEMRRRREYYNAQTDGTYQNEAN